MPNTELSTENLSEIIKVTARNRRDWQLDHYGKCLTEEDEENILRDSLKHIMWLHSKDVADVSNIIKSVTLAVKWYESNLSRDIVAQKAEYGM